MNKKTMAVGELKEFIKDLSDDMKIYIASNDEQPAKSIVNIWEQIRIGYDSELYIEAESNK